MTVELATRRLKRPARTRSAVPAPNPMTLLRAGIVVTVLLATAVLAACGPRATIDAKKDEQFRPGIARMSVILAVTEELTEEQRGQFMATFHSMLDACGIANEEQLMSPLTDEIRPFREKALAYHPDAILTIVAASYTMTEAKLRLTGQRLGYGLTEANFKASLDDLHSGRAGWTAEVDLHLDFHANKNRDAGAILARTILDRMGTDGIIPPRCAKPATASTNR